MIPLPLATFFAKPLVKFGVPVLIVVLAYFAFQWWLSDVKDDARQEGLVQERTGALIETINRMERADNAAETIRRNPDARRAECLRHARNPEDC